MNRNYQFRDEQQPKPQIIFLVSLHSFFGTLTIQSNAVEQGKN
jgi:hypothetical protein